MKYVLNDTIKEMLIKLNDSGFDAYIVGGAVRSMYMGKTIKDWDITTNALPDEIENLFDKTIPTGKAFGTITVVNNNMNVEVTTFRKELGYSDCRKPDKVIYSKNILDDLDRRDFTMNTMLLDSNGCLIDNFNGLRDIDSRQIQCVGNARNRLLEDYLRVFRYVRFTSTLGFIENPFIDEVILDIPFSTNLSVERIREEFNKIILSEKPSNGIRHLRKLKLLEIVIPEIKATYDFDQHSKYHHLDVFEHTMEVLDNTPAKLELRLAALLHDIGKPSTFEIIEGEGHFYGHDKKSAEIADIFLSNYKYSNIEKIKIITLVKNHMRLLDTTNTKSVKKFMNKLGLDLLDGFLDLRKADILACITQDDLHSVEIMRNAFEEIKNKKEPTCLKDLAINGHDLMEVGVNGKKIGLLLNEALEHILEYPSENTKEKLFKYLKNNGL